MSEIPPNRLGEADRNRLLRRMAAAPVPSHDKPVELEAAALPKVDLATLDFFAESQLIRRVGEMFGIANPFMRPHEATPGATIQTDGTTCINFSSYNYLGLNGHPQVVQAAKAAIDRYGTSASASRMVGGEISLHGELERELAALHDAQAALVLVSGHATNVTIIGHLLGPPDAVFHDALIHNSVLEGARLSRAKRFSFVHNDVQDLERQLKAQASAHRRLMVVVESHYSMDGDVAPLPAIAEAASRYGAWLMVDEAHGVGVLGGTGRGAAEHFGLAADAVDIWMGTLSKSLAGCGGYVAGSERLIEYLKVSAPGFIYSVGLSPPLAAASLAALQVMKHEPWRVAKLNANAKRFRNALREGGLNTGSSEGFSIVPVITGSSIQAARLSHALGELGVSVNPILFPAVPEGSARLRFFVSSLHSEQQVDEAAAVLLRQIGRLEVDAPDYSVLMAQLTAAS
ncbi:aminotransferase class I/II-fold pyridoxal phosphate-dependent enzyme [Caulobacter sp. S45]|uniref:aminotransferase class I/II-fold pyridoxal phosphate-dependent enzyme n=1 Tax=Caulobacter sp. S45 TaxID=1641861 RepID=UPI001575ECD6|nr:aminotransferase class I/II-fold pyridoxal phosphate-dependent enzyme [Caulobacter sp. S45]